MVKQDKQKLNERFLFIGLAAIGIWSLVLIPFLDFYIKLLENANIVDDLTQHENSWAVWLHFFSFVGLLFLYASVILFLWYAIAVYISAFVLIYEAKKMKKHLSLEEIEEYLKNRKENGFCFVDRFKRKQIAKIFNIDM